ncbi:Acetate kinase [Chlamydiales bacterium STE3]|nr:Acetate kinase [Chlamydiales bacterium STE3]
MMRIMNAILVFNAGSTSLKFSLFQATSRLFPIDTQPVFKGLVEKEGRRYRLVLQERGGKTVFPLRAATLLEAALKVKDFLPLNDVRAVGHRVVHGGAFFTQPVILNRNEMSKIKKVSSLAPLHNPMNLEGVKIAKKLLPKALQIAVFDTAFHSSIPLEHQVYPIPYRFFKKGIRRYGFHGINHQYCMEKIRVLLKGKIQDKKLINCHLGGGASLAAIVNGQSRDTTMGFTPLDGLMMSTRSGSIDPGIILYLLESEKMSANVLNKCLNDESGLKGICQLGDMRDIFKAREKGNEQAELALELYIQSLVKGIAAMAASLGGIDLLSFSGGIGENVAEIRQRACEALAFLNIKIEREVNEQCSTDTLISARDSRVKVFRIQANEEWLIAKETLALMS